MQRSLSVLLVLYACCLPAVYSRSYRAAVVEFAPKMWYDLQVMDKPAADQLKLANLASLASQAEAAKSRKAQIIVFPEYGITGDNQGNPKLNRTLAQPFLEHVPSIGSTPCGAAKHLPNSTAIVNASCLAQRLELVLVINLLTRHSCGGKTGCPDDGMLIHNSAIAFAEDGSLLAVYHKVHPWGHEQTFLDAGDAAFRNVTFSTSFGVEFGMFVCFDLVFFTDGGPPVMDIAYPTDWENGAVPGLNASIAQKTWSSYHGKNVLAANYGGNGNQSSGSGIWHKGQHLAFYYNPTTDSRTRLLVADVPLVSSPALVV